MTDNQMAGLFLILKLLAAVAIMAFAIGNLGFNAYGLGAGVGMISAILYTRGKTWYQRW